MQNLPYSLLAELDKSPNKGRPPVHLWHPEVQKDIDLMIDRQGVWWYQGSAIKRPRLVRLFASVLRREGDDYFLVTPVEKCRIRIEDAPFQGVLMDVTGEGKAQCLAITTDMGESIPVDAEHRLRIKQSGNDRAPYVMVRDGLEARLVRNVYYQLAELLAEYPHPESGDAWLGVWSCGELFPLLPADAADQES